MADLKKILIIQTAFIGDVILATSLVETLKNYLPNAEVDFVLRSGNEGLLAGNPQINKIHIWTKKEGKYKSLFQLSKIIRSEKYDAVVNLQRFASSGFLTWRSGSAIKAGFSNNPLSFFFTHKLKHIINNGLHETERNFNLLKCVFPELTTELKRPKIYPTSKAQLEVESLNLPASYLVMAPSSVWFTKQLPEKKWIDLIKSKEGKTSIFLIGAPGDFEMCERIRFSSDSDIVTNLAGKLSLQASALLIKGAQMNYVNDSAPLHLASAMNAPVTAFFCSTVPEFGFGPLSDNSLIVQVNGLSCRPCGLHGHKACPLGHFNCGNQIAIPA